MYGSLISDLASVEESAVGCGVQDVDMRKAIYTTCLQNASSNPATPGKQKLCGWLNKNFKIEMTDGRVLIGVFLCTDRDGNVILGSCSEYLKPEDNGVIEEPRVLGLVMVPGRHIVSIHLDDITNGNRETT